MTLEESKQLLKDYPPIVEVELIEDKGLDANGLMALSQELKKRVNKPGTFWEKSLVFAKIGRQLEIKIHSVLEKGIEEFEEVRKEIYEFLKERDNE